MISLPDILALIRIALVPVIMAFTRSDRIEHSLGIAAVLFAVAAFTDFLDGYVARRTTGGTTLGAFLDTTADKILVTGTLFALVSIDRVSIWPAVIIVFREFTVMALRGVVAERGGLIRPSTWGKIKAAAQFTAIFWAFLRFPDPWGPWFFDQWLMLIAVIATVGSAWGYVSAFWYTTQADDGRAVTVEVDSDGHRFMVPASEPEKDREGE
ncbi:MAG TPA: CDP-diacylglycerol--glycerol-3-phosphate 3-phosphatidyltransferase [Acidimicrobiia bacterium]|nr:CDP-diacylglycerol--glycerol-3-phosphate 3-phosphatidyltransferase [Acidimicrobiia bacterium]